MMSEYKFDADKQNLNDDIDKNSEKPIERITFGAKSAAAKRAMESTEETPEE